MFLKYFQVFAKKRVSRPSHWAPMLLLCLSAGWGFAQSGPESKPSGATPVEAPAAVNPPGIPSPEKVAATARRLGLPEVALQDAAVGLGHVYARRYGKAQAIFDRITTEYADLTIGPFGNVLLYQAWMLENFDFAKESGYLKASKLGLERAESGIENKKNEAWNEFVWGVLNGLVSIYDIRKGEYVSALMPAIRSVPAMERAVELEPSFQDPILGLGVYNFWRTVLAEAYWFVPSIGDKKAEGIQQMYGVRDTAIFAGPGARLSLAYAYLQKRDVKAAKKACEELEALYPDNIINNMLLGRIALRQRKHAVARRYFDKIQRVDPSNWLVEYYIGLLEMRSRNFETAKGHFLTYLEHNGDASGEAWAHYRLGDVYWFLFQDDLAKSEWKKAVKKNDGMKGAKRRLDGQVPHRRPPGETRDQGKKGSNKGKVEHTNVRVRPDRSGQRERPPEPNQLQSEPKQAVDPKTLK